MKERKRDKETSGEGRKGRRGERRGGLGKLAKGGKKQRWREKTGVMAGRLLT
jgi:hypothetical protein